MSTLSPEPARPGRGHSRSPSRFGASFKRIFGSRDPSPNPATQQVASPPAAQGSASATPANNSTPTPDPAAATPTTTDPVVDEKSSLWTQAFARLSEKDKLKLGASATDVDRTVLDEITSRVLQKRDLCLSRQWKLRFGQREIVLRDVVDNVVGFVDQFKDVGELATSIDPVHAGLPWAGVCLLLEFATADSETMAAMLVGVEFATACISRCAFYEALYITPAKLPDDQLSQFKDILIDLYESILQFLSRMISYLDHNTAVRFLAATFSDTFKVAQTAVEGNEETVRMHASIADAYLANQNFEAMGEAQKEHFDMLHKMLDDMKEPIASLIRKMDDMKIVADENLDVARETHKLVQKAMNDKSRKVLSATIAWISRVDPQKRYRQLRDARQPGSGDWLIESDEMKKWLDITDGEKSFVWLQGRAGSGKSMQSATISHHIKENRPADHPFLEFYCDYSENREITTPDYILKSLLAQICGYAEDVPAKVKAAYQESQMTGLPLDMPVKELAQEIAVMLSLYTSGTIIVDALDECPDPKTLFASLYAIFDGVTSTDLRFLVTSRDNLRPLRSVLRTAPDAQVLDMAQKLDSINKDIRIFLEKKMDDMMANDDFTVVIDEDKDIQEEILDTLSNASDGIILYASLLLSEFARIPTKSKLREAIKTPPVGLHALFVNCLQRIASDRWFHLDTAQKVCMWVLTAKRQLHIDEIREAISIEPGETLKWDEDDFAEKILIRECAAGLLLIDEEGLVRFVHGSLVDFFLGECPFGSEDPLAGFFWSLERRNEVVVTSSLSYLGYEDFEISASKNVEDLKSRLRKYKLLEYSSKFWFRHFKGSLEVTHEYLFLNFIQKLSEESLQAWLEILFTDTEEFWETSKYHFNFGTGMDLPYGQYPHYENKASLRRHLVCMFGFQHIMHNSSSEERLNMASESNSHHQTGVYVALGWNQWDFVESLVRCLEEGQSTFNQLSSTGYGALHIAATSGRLNLVQTMVEKGANPCLERDGIQPLSMAARNGNAGVVDFLISKGPEINLISPKTGFFPLFYACAAGRVETIRSLLAAGADIMLPSSNPEGLTAMHIAATAGNEEVLHTILDNLPTEIQSSVSDISDAGVGSTPLMVTDSASVTRILLSHGADPRKRSKLGFTALDVAQSQARLPVMAELLRVPEGRECLEMEKQLPEGLNSAQLSGLDISSYRNLEYIQKPLMTALFTDTLPVVDMILKAAKEHPSLNIYSGEKEEKELDLITSKMNPKLLDLVLSNGFDVNHKFAGKTPLLVRTCQYLAAESPEYKNLVTISQSDILKQTQALLKHGVDIDAADEKGGTALHCASYRDGIEVAKLLLDKGAGVSTRNMFMSTPMHNAASPEMVKLLQSHGAALDDLDSLKQSVAHFSANRGVSKILEYIQAEQPSYKKLLTEPQMSGFTPLTFAIHSGHLECVKVLLPITDLTWKVEGGNSYLHSAVEGPNLEILQVVLQEFKTKGMSIDLTNAATIPPIMLAAALRKPTYLKYLIDEGANAMFPWPTPDLAPIYPMATSHLSLAILTEDETFDEIVEVLLEYNTTKQWMKTPDNHGNGPLHYAVKNKKRMERLIKEGFDLKLQNDMGDTPLHFATRFEGTEEVEQLLVMAGADLDIMNKDGKRAGDMLRRKKGAWGWFGF